MDTQATSINSTNSVVKQTDNGSMSSRVVSAIKSAAAKTGVDFTYLLQKASQESGLDPTAKAATSSATGLFQFTNQTWLQMVKQNGAQYGLATDAAHISTDSNGHLSVSDPTTRQAILGLRNDPQISAEMAGELDKQNATSLQQNVGGKIGRTELYLAHFLGAGGASDFLNQMRSNPTVTGASVLPEAASANTSVFYTQSGAPRTLQQIYQHFAQKFDGSSATQMASTAPTVSNTSAFSAASSSSLASNIASLMPTSYSAPSSGSSLSVASYRTASASNVTLSGSATLFSAMLLGQMNESSIDPSSPLSSLNQLGDKKHNNLATLANAA